MDERLDRIRARGVQVEHHTVRLARDIAAEITRTVRDFDIDLLVVRGRGRGYPHRRALGDISLRLVRDAPCSVLVVREERGQPTSAGRDALGRRRTEDA